MVEGFAPTLVETHIRVLFGAFLIGVDRDRGVLRAGAVRLQQDHRGKERHAGHVLWAVPGLERGGRSGEAELLASCYRHSLKLAVAHGLKSIAFPAISCGAYGYPLEKATAIAVGTVRVFEGLDALEKVLFACAQPDVLAAYERVLAETS